MVKNPPVNAGDATKDEGSIPGSGRSPGGGNGDLFQYSCLENSTGRVVWRPSVHRVTKNQTQLSTNAHIHIRKPKVRKLMKQIFLDILERDDN